MQGLTTLSQREYRSGLAEVITHDTGLARRASPISTEAFPRCSPETWHPRADRRRLMPDQGGVAERDEQEAQLRHAHNDGRTTGHAGEAVTA